MVDLQLPPTGSSPAWEQLTRWPLRRWAAAVGAALVVAVLIGMPTDVIPNPVFGRPVSVTWWSYPTLVIVALGATGARQWFEPLQPLLALASIVLLAWALRARLRSTGICRI